MHLPSNAGLLRLSIGLCALNALHPHPGSGNDGADTNSLTLDWKIDGDWTGLASRDGKIYALDASGRCLILDREGNAEEPLQLGPDSGSRLQVSCKPDGDHILIAFTPWNSDLTAFGLDGNPLWIYPRGHGINAIWASPRRCGSQAQILVAHNGAKEHEGHLGMIGLQALGVDGSTLWNDTQLSNVWNAAGTTPTHSESRPIFGATSSLGLVHLYGDGPRRDIDPGFYATKLHFWTSNKKGKGTLVIAIGTTLGLLHKDATERPTRNVSDLSIPFGPPASQFKACAVSILGEPVWTVSIPRDKGARIYSSDQSTSYPFMAVGFRGGRVVVINAETGAMQFELKDQGPTPMVCWLRDNPQLDPVLLVSSGEGREGTGAQRSLRAYLWSGQSR